MSHVLRTAVAATLALAAALAPAARAQAPAPQGPAAPRIVTAEQVKALVDKKAKVVLVDTRTPDEWAQAHLPGAVNVPAGFVRALSNRLPRDKGTPLVFYCRGSGCTLSLEAAAEAAALGYRDLAIYQAGIPDWLLKRYPVQAAPPAGKGK